MEACQAQKRVLFADVNALLDLLVASTVDCSRARKLDP